MNDRIEKLGVGMGPIVTDVGTLFEPLAHFRPARLTPYRHLDLPRHEFWRDGKTGQVYTRPELLTYWGITMPARPDVQDPVSSRVLWAWIDRDDLLRFNGRECRRRLRRRLPLAAPPRTLYGHLSRVFDVFLPIADVMRDSEDDGEKGKCVAVAERGHTKE